LKLGVNFAWHVHPWKELLGLVERAEELGYDAAFIDGDIAMLSERRNADVFDGWTALTALLARTKRIQIGSLRLVHHWNAARLAQSITTLQHISSGRLRFLISIGDRPGDAHFGLPDLPRTERIEWLDETLTGLRALFRGDSVTLRGRFLELEEARVRPVPANGKIPIGIAAAKPRMLELVAAHADVWDINLPAVPARVRAASLALGEICESLGRDPDEIERSMLIYCRVGAEYGEQGGRTAALEEYRRLNPWFNDVPDEEIEHSLVLGDAACCRDAFESLASEIRLDLPVVDLSGLAAEPSLAALEALAPRR
jgi:alkanesulfonate monooxygenase SsuD/methylene tetrahydromethanopterin reductase-like flavin-dependent oxidoreductase (luciferase family)